MNIVHVMSLILKVIIKCGYHVLYNPNDGIHITPVISYTVVVMSSKRGCDDICSGRDVSFNVFQVRYRAGLVIHTVWVSSIYITYDVINRVCAMT